MAEKKDDLFNDENVPESNWFKFDKVGDRVSGILVEVTDKEGKGDFPAQRVFDLKQDDGTIIHVGISLKKDYVIGRANTAKMGDTVGFEFKKIIEPKVKGYQPAKSIEVYVKHNEEIPQGDDASWGDEI